MPEGRAVSPLALELFVSSSPKHRSPRPAHGRKTLGRTLTAVTGVSLCAALSVSVMPDMGWWTTSEAGPRSRATAAGSTVTASPTEPEVTAAVAAASAARTEGPTEKAVSADTVAKRRSAPVPDLSKMTLDELRVHSAKIQSEFVTSSLAYDEARSQAVQADAAAQEATAESEEAAEDAESARTAVATTVTEAYMSDVALSPVSRALSGDSDSLAKIVEDSVLIEQFGDASASALRAYEEARAEAAEKAAQAADASQTAADAEAEAEAVLSDIQQRAEALAAAAGELVEQDGGPALSSAEQEARNQAAVAQWQAYQQKVALALSRKGLHVPRAHRLANPRRLPKKFQPVLGSNDKPVKGVAAVRYKSEALTVLPRETVKAVNFAFRQIGKPYVADSTGPQTFDCTGLAVAAWQGPYAVAGARPVRLLKSTAPVATRNIQVGDLVFFTAPGDGVQHVGLNLGGKFMLAADAATQQVGVQQFPSAVVAASRPVLSTDGPVKAPRSAPDAASRCGGLDAVASSAIFGWPVDPDAFEFSSTFGEQGELWASGRHTGLDFSAAAGTPVFAAKGGTVVVQSSSWAGPHHVVIDHGDGMQTAYAHMRAATVATGDVVAAGQQIGEVGSEGNSTGPHLHFEALVDGVKVDPMLFLPGGGEGPGWGGFANGMIPSEALCALNGVSYHALRCDAATAYDAMSQAYVKQFGTAICITDSYRSFAAQVRLYAEKPGLAAVPGTSNHGWAMAVDLCGGIESFSSVQHAWMVANAPKFGWLHPDWARQGGGREEPWHWEFGRIS